MDALDRSTGFEVVVVVGVGVDGGGDKRMTDLSPFTNPYVGVAEGKAYLAFVVHMVKPMIDSHFHTFAVSSASAGDRLLTLRCGRPSASLNFGSGH